jgi:hypothetical protein
MLSLCAGFDSVAAHLFDPGKVQWLTSCCCCHLQCIIIGLSIGSLFFQVPADRSGVRVLLGGSFITIMFLAFGSAPELGLLLMNRP